MKKKIPKFDQKAWDEKQAKSADNYSKSEKGFTGTFTLSNTGNSSNRVGKCQAVIDVIKTIQDSSDKHMQKAFEDAAVYGSGLIPILTVPKDKLAAQYPPLSIGSRINLNPDNGTIFLTPGGIVKYIPTFPTLGDPYDLRIFDGDSEDTQLPSGYDYLGQGWIRPDPAFEKPCCQPDDFINVGFQNDKWVCKKCNKEKK